MSGARATSLKSGRRPTSRLGLIVALSLAFLLQSYAVQTHIHERLAAASITHSQNDAPRPINPVDDSQDNCRLCQLFHAGQYLAPTAIAFFAFLLVVSNDETLWNLPPWFAAVSHTWRGRGPPHA